ncbi:hypothetical protein EIP91_003248 [Steccherinum ochraceum]|uniref:Uncharacterized protein n=1 Tax=Steccherinum ochraceum TaxID=92696 RepID=A0A4V2MXK9_9APHY|nr:hypothetical protein EIP91_003248 [Steccherinum ochraceum]
MISILLLVLSKWLTGLQGLLAPRKTLKMSRDISVYRREPTLDEVAEASAHIATSVKDITALQSQIQELQDQMRMLQRQQAGHYRDIERHKGVITLARRIPPELLASIFEICVDGGWTRGPIVVSHVCSQWRLAAQDPRVWSRIYVNLDDTNTIGRMRHWLRMARAAPLDITLVASARVWPRYVSDVMTLLSKHSEQWVSLTLDVEALQNVQAVVTSCLLLDTLPHLRTVRITTMGVQVGPLTEGESEGDLALAQAFTPERAPSLHTLSLHLVSLPERISLPSHLLSLKLDFAETLPPIPIPAQSLVDLLNPLERLERLSLSLPLQHEQPFILEPDQSITLESLTSLTIFGPTDLNDLLSYVRAPSLRQLRLRSLEDLGYRQTPIGPSLHAFLQASPLVEHLELYDVDLSPEYFASCFPALENLTELRLHESAISGATLKLLYGRGHASYGGETAPSALRMCPRLTKLDVRWCGHLSGKSLVELVRSRLPPPKKSGDDSTIADATADAPITEITAINCCFVEEQDVLDLAKTTLCRVVIRDSDYCHLRRCCDNLRYRQRLQFRHFMELSPEQRSSIRLIL